MIHANPEDADREVDAAEGLIDPEGKPVKDVVRRARELGFDGWSEGAARRFLRDKAAEKPEKAAEKPEKAAEKPAKKPAEKPAEKAAEKAEPGIWSRLVDPKTPLPGPSNPAVLMMAAKIRSFYGYLIRRKGFRLREGDDKTLLFASTMIARSFMSVAEIVGIVKIMQSPIGQLVAGCAVMIFTATRLEKIGKDKGGKAGASAD